MPSRPKVDTFTQNWNKTVQWAQKNNIPYQVYYPIYQLDAQRLVSGTPMGEAERIQAIESAQGLSVSTALPTDAVNPTDVISNVKTNAANIFTGLEPQHLLGNIWDTVTNTIQHPSTVYGAIEDFGKVLNPLANQKQTLNAIRAFDAQVTGQHAILSWVPGFYDAALLTSGQGKTLALNPLTALLDILPLGRAIPSEIADSSLGAQVAGKLGITTDELRKMDSIQLAYRSMKLLPWPGKGHPNVVTDAANNPLEIKPMRIGERLNAARNAANIGKTQGDLQMGAIIGSDEGTRGAEKVAGPVMEALSNLPREEALMAMKAIATDHRPIQDLLDDPQYTDPVHDALDKYSNWAEFQWQIKMQAGDAAEIPTQFGIEKHIVKPGSRGRAVQVALRKSRRLQNELDKASQPLDSLIYRTQESDRRMHPLFDTLKQQTDAVYGALKANLINPVRSIMPTAERWDNIVKDQTPLVRNLFGIPPKLNEAARRLQPDVKEVSLTTWHTNALRDLFSPGGLLDQIKQAYDNQDWAGLAKFSKAAMRTFNNKVFKDIPTEGNAFLFKVKQVTSEIHDYAVQRDKDVQSIDRIVHAKNGTLALSKRAAVAHDQFLATAIKNPPAVWDNVFLDEYVKKIMNDERSAEIVDKAGKALIARGMAESEVDKMRQDPRTIVELIARSSKDAMENSKMPDIDVGLSKELQDDAYNEVASLRAMGHTPMYAPMISAHDVPEERLNFDVKIRSLRAPSVASSFDRVFDFKGSIFDLQAAILKDTKDQLTKDVTDAYIEKYVKPQLLEAAPLHRVIEKYLETELGAAAIRNVETGIRHESVDALIQQQVIRMGYITYDPTSIFGPLQSAKLSGDYYIHKDLASALDKSVNRFQFPAQGFWDKGTKLFRFSILGLSPRYTAHIVFGGTWLVAARGHPSMFRQLHAGWHIATTGKLPDKVLARYPHAQEHMTTAATQEGQADITWHRAAAYTMGNKIIEENLDKQGLARTAFNWLKVASQANMRFTRAFVRGQRAIVYLDGAARAEKEGSFTELVQVPRIDDNGQRVVDPNTNRQLFDEIERRSEMTPAQAHEAGMKAVAQVMGELRHMTPLERQLFVRVFPFYGWTKHVLTYVLTYPIDHPYRATFLSQLATQNSESVPSGLPTRIQLLMFLGHPDEFGNVSAIDTRALDPLRDTANYASLTGLFQSLNPILSAPIAQIDPQISFGGNELYPHLTYSQLYGVKEAGPQGSLYNVAEQFVPQLTAIDAAFNLSGQYAYLKSQGGDAFTKKVFQSLNIPFFQIQHINLRQIAAQQEIDRYSISANAAYEAASTGDMSYIAGYPANAQLPDPLNTMYNVTPAYIEALTQESKQKYGLPFTETMTRPPNPPF